MIEKGLAAVEALIATNRDARYCVGSHPSIADACLVPQLYNARRYECDVAKFPRGARPSSRAISRDPPSRAHLGAATEASPARPRRGSLKHMPCSHEPPSLGPSRPHPGPVSVPSRSHPGPISAPSRPHPGPISVQSRPYRAQLWRSRRTCPRSSPSPTRTRTRSPTRRSRRPPSRVKAQR